MATLLQNSKDKLSSLVKLVDRLCKLNPKYTPRHSEQELGHQRNKSIVIIYICVITCFVLDLIFGSASAAENLLRIFFCVVSVLALFVSNQYNPQIFKWYYMVMCVIYGPSAIFSNPDGIYIAYVFTLIVPLFVQLITGGFIHFLVSAVIKNIFLNTFYQVKMKEMMETASPEEVLQGLTKACNMTMALQAILLCLVNYFINQGYNKALEFEQKKNEAENQKVFLLGFSHELRNLINSLTGNVKLATLETLGVRARDFLHNAELCGELLLHMVNNILDTGKSQINELEINMTPTQTYETFQGIWAICSELIKRKDLAGCMKIPRRLPRTLMMDQHRLTQIFLNLVGNAVKFTDKGSINVTVEWLNHKQEVREECFQPYPFNSTDDQDEGLYEKQARFMSLNDSYFTLSKAAPKVNHCHIKPSPISRRGVLKMTVIDTGCGMTEKQMDQLFQKFSQVCTDEGKKKLGTGLGLFITKQLCQKMNGEVRAFSEKGRGSAFIFCLPAETTDDNLPMQVPEDFDSLRKKIEARQLKVMVVDDALANHDLMCNFFGNLGTEVKDIAVNGLEAYQKYLNYLNRGNPFNIVTMDLDMPIMNGKEASRKIRELEKEKGVEPCFLLIISGNCVDSEVTECLDKNGSIRADAFIRKPIKMEELMRIVASYTSS